MLKKNIWLIVGVRVVCGMKGWRRKALASEFGFTCCCIACAAEEKDEVQRFQEAAKRNLTSDKKEEDGEVERGRVAK